MIETQARVLVVDDEPEICGLMKWRLEDAGYEVDVFTDPREALGDLKRGSYELVISDIRMPKMGGMKFIREAKRRDPDLASIVITGFASLENAVEAVRHEVDDYLMKPFDIDEIARAVDRVVGNARYRKRRRTVVKELRRANKKLSLTSHELKERVKNAKAELLCRNYGVAQSFHMGDLLDLVAIELDLSPADAAILLKNENDLTAAEEDVFLNRLKALLGEIREFIEKQYANSNIPEPARRRVWQLALSDQIIQKGYVGIIDGILYHFLGQKETYSIARMVEKNPKLDRDGIVKTGRGFLLCRACHLASLAAIGYSVWALLGSQTFRAALAIGLAFFLDFFGRKAPVIRLSGLLGPKRAHTVTVEPSQAISTKLPQRG